MWGENDALIQEENDKLERGKVNELNKREKGHTYHMPAGFPGGPEWAFLHRLHCTSYTLTQTQTFALEVTFALRLARLNCGVRINAEHYTVRGL